ncbi:formylglycine-generating enzyme family protein [Treponema zioleckii]|uniref:formylglycine-generating enzyme family protein n=1 Tax=Treponema zioleckii TaxID=331680 RepID=UPI00168BF15E|nr:SUMF1/EgtB/PvdO family nonheme iron enzyme [Treponema zioleckii]
MKKVNVKALVCALCAGATFGFVSCYTDSKYEELETSSHSSSENETKNLKSLTMKKIESGSFKFGDETKTIDSFFMAETETTQKLYKEIMGTHECSSEGDDLPVDKVRFYETLVFCNKLSEKEGLTPVYKKGGESNASNWGDVPTSDDATWNAITEDSSANGFRLPHKDEWVFAALGTNASEDSGDYRDYYSGCIGRDELAEFAWAGENSAQIHQVAQKKANSNGLYDMSGNVWELCWDAAGDGKQHVRIGGDSKDCIPLSESWDYPNNGDWGQVGFRVVQKSE